MELEEYAAALAAETPTPGGGSAATIVAALGAGLIAMVARITLANPKHAAVHTLARDLVRKADALRQRTLQARGEDEAAYGAVVAATALPRASAQEREARTAALQRSLTLAAEAPLDVAEMAKLIAILATRSLDLGNQNLASDVGCAAEFAAAALAACAFNVRVNHRYMKDRSAVENGERRLRGYETEIAPLVKRVRFEVQRALAL